MGEEQLIDVFKSVGQVIDSLVLGMDTYGQRSFSSLL